MSNTLSKGLLGLIYRGAISFETAFVLFLFAGRFKNDPRLNWMPIDLTVFFCLLSISSGIWVLYKRGFQLKRNSLVLSGLFGGFVVYGVFSYLWSPSSIYAVEKMGRLAVLTLWALLGSTLVINGDRSRTKRFLGIVFVFSCWVLIESVVAFVSGERGQLITALGGRYQGLGRVLGVGAIILLMYVTGVVSSKVGRIIGMLLFAAYMASLAVLGGRGPLIATVVALFIPIVWGIECDVRKGRLYVKEYWRATIVTVVVGGIIVGSYAATETLLTISRLSQLLGGEVGASAGIRIQMYGEAIAIWADNPIVGAGIGGWPILAGWGDQHMYPHNIILEILAEFGVVGITIVSVVLGYALYQFKYRQWRGWDVYGVIVAMILVNTIGNAMVTGDITDNRMVFTAIGLLLLDGDRRGSDRKIRGHSVAVSDL